ncbi:MAG: protein kinase, partial [Candidatus Eisenbacteria bacterium]
MIGRTISHYRILEKIGEGGMGVVYKAEDTKLKRTVALKFLPPELTRDPEARQRFFREAQAASALDHPNICNIHEVDESEDGQIFISMAFYEGESLKDRIRAAPLEIEEVLSIAIQTAEGLQEAHKKSIVHRDVKPGNIMITSGGTAKVMDFGLARSAGRTALTKSGTTLGTAAYMSPEQARGEESDHRADIWSLGVVLYEMLAGRPPFRGDHEAAVIYSILNENPPAITGLRTGVPVELERIVGKALEKERERRYQRIAEFLVDLKNARDRSGSTSFPARRKRSARVKILIPLLLVAAVAAALLFGRNIGIERRPPPVAAENTLAVMYFDNMVDPEDSDRLGEIVTNLLITDLSESPRVRVVSSQRLYDILKLLGREGTKRIDRETASMVAEKANARWMLLGGILQVDPGVVLTAQIVEVASGNVTASQRVEGGVDEMIFPIVDRLTVEIREDLSIPAGGPNEPDRPVAEVTTHSPEAYRYYLEGEEYLNKFYWDESKQSFEKAIAHDSTFALAYFRLALHAYYNNLPGQDRMLAKAVEYSGNVTDQQRRHIAVQEAILTGDYERGIAELKEIAALYPDDKTAWLRLGIIHGFTLGRYEESIPFFEKAIEVDPLYKVGYNMLAYAYRAVGETEKSLWAINQYISMAPDEANPYDSRGDLYAYDGRVDQAIDSYKQANAVKPGFSTSKLGCLHLLKGEYEEADRYFQLRLSSPDKGERSSGRTSLALIPLHQGKFDEALGILDQGMAADRIEKSEAGLVAKHLLRALIHEERGDSEKALAELEKLNTVSRMAVGTHKTIS